MSASPTGGHFDDVTHSIALFLSDQYLNTAGINKTWRDSYGDLPKHTRGIDENTTVDQFLSHLEAGFGKAGTEISPNVYVPVFARCSAGPCNIAAHIGRLDLLIAAYDNGFAVKSVETCAAASAAGHLAALKFLRASGCPWDEKTTNAAGLNGHFEVLAWSIENGCPSNHLTVAWAAASGNLEMVKWLRQNGHEIDATVVSNAVSAGGVEIVEWARSIGLEWTSTFADAVEAGEMGMLNHLLESRHQWDRNQIIDVMDEHPVSREVEGWLFAHGYLI